MELSYEDEEVSKPKYRLLREVPNSSSSLLKNKETIRRRGWIHSDDRSHHDRCTAKAMKRVLLFFGLSGVICLAGMSWFLQYYLEFPKDDATTAWIRIVDPNCDKSSPSMRYPGPLSFFLMYATTYGLSLLIGGFAFFSAFCAGQCGCLVFQAAVLDIFVVHPLNATLYVLYRILWPLRVAWRHLLTFILVPFVSFFHVTPSFWQASLQDFVKAVPFAFSYGGLPNFLDMKESELRLKIRAIVQRIFPRITRWIPDVFLTNTIFRLALGFAMVPLAWWLVDEIYMIPFSARRVDKYFDASLDPPRDDQGDFMEEDEIAKSSSSSPKKEKPAQTHHKDLDVTFVFPKCKFLLEARKTYKNHLTGNKVCRRECRLLLEELTGQLLGHQFKVEPNLRTARCTFSIRTEPWLPDKQQEEDDEEKMGDCACDDGEVKKDDPLAW